MKKKEQKSKQSMKAVISNNSFMLKQIFQASPGYLIFVGIEAIRGQLFIFMEHTLLIGFVLDAAVGNYPFTKVGITILAVALLVSLGLLFFGYVSEYVNEKKRPVMMEKVKMAIYEKIKDIDLECYDDPAFYNNQVLAISELEQQIDRNVQFVRSTLEGVTVFFSVGTYFLIRDRLSVVFAIASFLMAFLFNKAYGRLSYALKLEKNKYEKERKYINRVFYLPEYAKEIRMNPNVANKLMDQFENTNQKIYQVEKKYAVRRFWVEFLGKYVANDVIADVFYISYLVIKAGVFHTLRFSDVAILFNSFSNMKRGLSIFTDVYPVACENSLYIGKIKEFMAYEPRVRSVEGIGIEKGMKDLQLDQVSFRYHSNDKPILNGIDLKISAGEKIALVGYNGAGKTTLVKLLTRLYDVTAGAIRVAGRDIRQYDLQEYRADVGTVFQDFKIFAGTVRENVIMESDEHADRGRVQNALEKCGLWQKVEGLEAGMDTNLTKEFSDDGVNLSGGESQKLACARAFFKQADFVILDEPSSALDPIAEYQLNQAMLQVTENKTVIFISHRLSTTRLADRIILLDHGGIAEQGSHEELLAINGKYAEMWRVQASAYN